MSNTLARWFGQGPPVAATSAKNDTELVWSWIHSMGSLYTRRNCTRTAERFVAALGVGLREATVEDVRRAIEAICLGMVPSSQRQQTLRVKSLLGYAHRLGYTMFNAGAAVKAARATPGLAKRIIGELDVRDLIRQAKTGRDRLLLEVLYAGGLRCSELVGLSCGDVIKRADGRLQLNVIGKFGKERVVLLPGHLTEQLEPYARGYGPKVPVFRSRKQNGRMTTKAVVDLVKRCAASAGINPGVSPHWLRHAHASHALDRGAPIHVVSENLGHANVSATTPYLHARPDSSSSDYLNPDVFDRKEKP